MTVEVEEKRVEWQTEEYKTLCTYVCTYICVYYKRRYICMCIHIVSVTEADGLIRTLIMINLRYKAKKTKLENSKI